MDLMGVGDTGSVERKSSGKALHTKQRRQQRVERGPYEIKTTDHEDCERTRIGS